MKLTVLGSSSHGNCYLLSTDQETLIIECGLKWKDIQRGLNFNLSNVIGCLVTHEHKDHSQAIQDVIRAGIDVYCSDGTANALHIEGHRVNHIKALQQFKLGPFTILPFPTEHDAAEPVGFLIYHQKTGEKLLFATDTFYVRNRFTGLNYIMVECNYYKDILQYNIEEGLISGAMSSRLLQSHFELENVKEFLKANVTTDTRQIVLLHLSDGNSDTDRMIQEIAELTGVETVVAEAGLTVELELYPF